MQLEPRDLYPLNAGNAWSYDVDSGNATTTLAVTRVHSFDGRDAEVRTGEARLRYQVRPEGIFLPEEGAWLIKSPIEEGTAWRARGGRTGRIVATNRSQDTPAGKFEDCVEIREAGGELDLQVRTIYCPRIGPVLVTSTMRSKTSPRSLSVQATLRGYETQ